MSRVSGSSRILGSTKNTTGICTSWPGVRRCSVKQKHWILVKYCPAWAGVTLKVAVPVTGRSARLRAVKRSEEHTSELQSRGLISYAVFCLKKNNARVRRLAKTFERARAHDRGARDVR